MTNSGSLHLRNNIWQFVFYYKNEKGETKQKSFSTGIKKGESKKRAKEIGLQKKETWLKEQLKKISAEGWTFAEWCEKWLTYKKSSIREITLQDYQYYQKQLAAFFGNLCLADIEREHIQAYCQHKLEAGLSPYTLRKHLVVVNGALCEACNRKLIPSNPCVNIDLPKHERHIGATYTGEEARRLLSVIDGEPLQPAIILGLFYGLRREEVCGLRWRDVDFDKGVMYIRNTVVHGKNGIIEQEATKSRASRRNLPLMEATIPYLKELKTEQAKRRKLSNYERADPIWHVCAHKKSGRPFQPNYVTTTFKKVLLKYDLPIITFHELRHTAGSLLHENGRSLKDIQVFLGHEDITTTANIYLHPSYTTQLETAAVMNNTLSPD